MLAVHLALQLATTSLTSQPAALPLPAIASTLPFAPASEPAPALPPSLPHPPPAVDPAQTTGDAPASTVPETAPVYTDDPALPPAARNFADPLEPINRVSYAISQPIDRFILRPAAIAYTKVVPRPLRDGARNAIQNIAEPLVIVNDVLQLRPKRALKGVARFLVNSVLGIGGLFDLARRKPFHIPHHPNGFSDTLGYYGIGPILYLYLPVLGPTTLRDTSGDYVDGLTQPRLLYKITHPDSDRPIWRTQTSLGKYGTIMRIVDGLGKRAENDQELEAIRSTSVDPYAALRSSFMQDRAGEIAALRAKEGAEAVNPHFDDPLADPAAK